MTAVRGWIGVDLDGTIARYDGWQGDTHIGPPIMDMVAIVRDILQRGELDVKIFTARVSGDDPDEVTAVTKAIRRWCLEHIGQSLEVTCKKDYKMVALYDDRAVQVWPNTGRTVMQDYADAMERLAAYEEAK
jgi:hypothetical protein